MVCFKRGKKAYKSSWIEELCAGTEIQAVGVNILLSANGTFDTEFLPFDCYETINFLTAAFTFSHVISPSIAIEFTEGTPSRYDLILDKK